VEVEAAVRTIGPVTIQERYLSHSFCAAQQGFFLHHKWVYSLMVSTGSST